MEKPTLSLCMIVKNEERYLHDCLVSVQSCVDEIIIVDTGSTDKTKEIARRFGAKIIDFNWINDFAAARNVSISNAKCDWVLYLDADERLLNPAIVKSELSKANNNIGGIIMTMLQWNSDETVKYEDNVIRIFRNHQGWKFEGSIHEQIVYSIQRAGKEIVTSQIQFKHIGYNVSREELIAKYERNLLLVEEELKQHPDNIYIKMYKAKTLYGIRRPDEAMQAFEDVINTDVSSSQLIEPTNMYAFTAFREGHTTKALEVIERSLKILPDQLYGNFIKAEIEYSLNNYPDAIESYKRAMNRIDNMDLASYFSNFPVCLTKEMLHYKIGRCHFNMRQFSEAMNEYIEGMKIEPMDVSLMVGIAEVAFNLDKFAEAKAMLQAAYAINPKFEQIADFIKLADEKLNVRVSDRINPEKLLSLCMIVKDEEKMLPECLESAKDIVDEIVIVDTGSTDNTKAIAERFGAKIYDFTWCNDFAAARNKSIKYATGKWILYLDADERLDSNANIRSLLDTAADNVGAFYCAIESEHSKLDNDTEMHRGAYPRLFRNLGYPTIKFVGRVHEQISPSLITAKKDFLFSDIIIKHLGYNLSREEMEKKIQRNYKMLIAHVQEQPTNGYAWFQLGQTLGQMQLYKEAEDATLFAINCGDLSDSVYASAAASLSQFCGRRKDFNEALKWADAALSKTPEQVFALSLKAHSLLYIGRKKEAEAVFLQALEKIKHRKIMPHSGFDIDISEEILLKGLKEART